MSFASISIIIPVYGGPRWRLPSVMRELKAQWGPNDQIVVIGDGPCELAQKIVEAEKNARIIYQEGPQTRMVGNAQRDLGITLATGDYLMFVDEENAVPPDALPIIRGVIAKDNDGPRPHAFAVEGHNWEAYMRRDPSVTENKLVLYTAESKKFGMPQKGITGGCQFVPPNIPEKLGSWSKPKDCKGIDDGGDVQFIRQTMEHYPNNCVFHKDTICYWLR